MESVSERVAIMINYTRRVEEMKTLIRGMEIGLPGFCRHHLSVANESTLDNSRRCPLLRIVVEKTLC